MSAGPNTATHPPGIWRRVVGLAAAVLRLYAACLLSRSLWVGACVLAATALSPLSGLLGLLAVACAVSLARALDLITPETPGSVYAYSALFIGLGAAHTFASPLTAFAFATFGGAAAGLLTASLRALTVRVGLPALSLPFLLVYLCAVSMGYTLGAQWAVPTAGWLAAYAHWVPAPLLLLLRALGAMVFAPRIDVGLLVLLALCLTNRHAPLFGLLALALVVSADQVLSLPPLLMFAALANAIFTAVLLGLGWSQPTHHAYARAAAGALLCVLLSIGLAEPLGRIGLVPLSLPFNLSVYAVLLVARQRALTHRPGSAAELHIAGAREPAQCDPVVT